MRSLANQTTLLASSREMREETSLSGKRKRDGEDIVRVEDLGSEDGTTEGGEKEKTKLGRG